MTTSHTLPKNWASARVGDICVDLQYGYTASATNEAVGPRFLRITDIQDGQVNWPSVPYCQIEKASFDKYALHDGDIVFARTGGTVGKSFIIGTVPEPSVFASYLIRLTSHQSVSPKYLYFFLQSLSYWQQIGLKKGGLQGNVNATTLASLELPLAPINEQRRIVAKIEELFSELDKGVESLITAREQLKAYRQSLLKAAFEGRLTVKWRRQQKALASATAIVAEALAEKARGKRTQPRDDTVVQPAVPDAWGTIALGDLSVDVFDGPFGSNLKTSDYVDAGVRVIRLENIGHGKFIEEKRSYVSMAKYEGLKRHTVVPGDIVVSSFVTDALRSTIVPGSVPVSINKADCFAVRFQGQAMLPEFAQRFFESRCAYKQMEGMIHGVGRPRINTTQLKQLILPICSRAEQIEVLSAISAAYSEIDALEAELSVQVQKIYALRQSILKRAFSGQLVAEDPADEPAFLLLERIRAEREESGTAKRPNSKNGKKEAA